MLDDKVAFVFNLAKLSVLGLELIDLLHKGAVLSLKGSDKQLHGFGSIS